MLNALSAIVRDRVEARSLAQADSPTCRKPKIEVQNLCFFYGSTQATFRRLRVDS